MKMRIICGSGDGERRLEISEFPANLGRDPSNQIHIEDTQASRHHASIQLQDGKPHLVDLDSLNGTIVNGARATRQLLKAGDEIRIGLTVIRIEKMEFEEAGSPLSPSRVFQPPRFRGLPMSYRIGILFFFICCAGATVYHLATRKEKPPPADPLEELHHQANSRLIALKRLIGTAPVATKLLIEQAESLQAQYAELYRGGEDPFADLLVELESRWKLENANRILELEESLQKLLDAKRYGKVLKIAREATERFRKSNIMSEEAALEFSRKLNLKLQEEYQRAGAEVDYLASLGRHEESRDLCLKALALFEGTPQEEQFQKKLELIDARITLAAEKQLEEMQSREAKEHLEPSVEKVPGPAAPGLASLLADPIRAGVFSSKVYRFQSFQGSPVGMKDDRTLILKGTAGEMVIPFEEIPADVQVAMALEGLSGDALLDAAAFGYAAGLEREPDRLLWKYIQEDRESAARKNRVQETLARARGFGRVPEGGFTYSPRFGWEDAQGRMDREGVAEVIRLQRMVSSAASRKTLEKHLQKILSFVSDPRLSPRGRAEAHRHAVEGLGKLRKKLQQKLSSGTRSSRKGFGKMRIAREELKRRRSAALKIIFDTSVYLPENHPKYAGSSDDVTGQRKVDEAVASVRELWEMGKNLVVEVSPSAMQTTAMLQLCESTLEEKLFQRLDEEPGELEEVLNNLERVVSLHRYASTRAEADLHFYNRKVEVYNRDLRSPDLSEKEREHIQLVNDYREMLGLRRLFIDIRLCRATRKHSAACNAAGRIWHSGPDGSPSSRARAEGFPRGVAENVAMGYSNPRDIWTRGWYRASDHHRNALSSGHRCIGYGYAGSVGTQNFSSIAAPFQ